MVQKLHHLSFISDDSEMKDTKFQSQIRQIESSRYEFGKALKENGWHGFYNGQPAEIRPLDLKNEDGEPLYLVRWYDTAVNEKRVTRHELSFPR